MADSSSPALRRLALLIAFTPVFALVSLAPLPVAQARLPATVVRTVGVSPDTLVAPGGPQPLVATSASLRAAADVRTPLTTVCSSIWSTMVTFVWNQASGGPIRARVVAPAARPASIIDDPDALPDRGTPEWHPERRASPLYWTKGSRCVRFSLRISAGTAVSDLRAMFLNTSGTENGPGAAPRATGGPGLLGSLFGAPAAEAMPAEPHMVTRAEWGAAKPRRNCFGYEPSIKMAYVHHTSGTNAYSRAQSDDIVRGIQAYHEFGRGYCDIAYNFLVDRFGTIYVGRYDSDNTSVNVTPGSQMGFNPYTFSVSAMGNFQGHAPPRPMIHSIERVLAWRLDVAHLDPLGTAVMTSTGGSTTRYHAGQTVRLPLISGHRQTGITDCPGNRIWWRLLTMRRVVFRMGMPKFFDPRESATEITPVVESDRVLANAPVAVRWEVDVTDEHGEIVRRLLDAGTTLDVSWDGTDGNGGPVLPGAYELVITARNAGGIARSASLPVTVSYQPFPTPTP